jgi:hypothetical protein
MAAHDSPRGDVNPSQNPSHGKILLVRVDSCDKHDEEFTVGFEEVNSKNSRGLLEMRKPLCDNGQRLFMQLHFSCYQPYLQEIIRIFCKSLQL